MDLYLGEKVPDIECDNLDEAKLCLYVMKEIYHSRMQEYISELTDISQKLQKYDYLLSKKYSTPSDSPYRACKFDGDSRFLFSPF